VKPSEKRQADFDRHFAANCVAASAWAYSNWRGACEALTRLPRCANQSARDYLKADIESLSYFREAVKRLPALLKDWNERHSFLLPPDMELSVTVPATKKNTRKVNAIKKAQRKLGIRKA
jgi:hypothetical protein